VLIVVVVGGWPVVIGLPMGRISSKSRPTGWRKLKLLSAVHVVPLKLLDLTHVLSPPVTATRQESANPMYTVLIPNLVTNLKKYRTIKKFIICSRRNTSSKQTKHGENEPSINLTVLQIPPQ